MTSKRTKRGFGSVERLASGRYRVRYTGPDGLRRSARMTYTSKASADKELTRILLAIESGLWHIDESPQGGDLDPRNMTLSDLARHWREQRVTAQGRQLSPRTLAEYERLIESTLFIFRNRPIRSITRQAIESWRAPEIHRAPNQTTKAYKHLKTLMTFAHKRSWILSNPCDLERATNYSPATRPVIPTLAQVELMLAESPEPLKAILALASWGGLRKGEIFELRRKDIEIIKGRTKADTLVWVHVRRGVVWQERRAIVRQPKSEKGKRAVPLPPRVTEILLAHLRGMSLDPEALLFERRPGSNEHWLESQLRPHWEAIRALAGFEGRFHSLRAFGATEFGKTGATAQEIMDRFGHKNIETAMLYQRSTGREADLVRLLG